MSARNTARRRYTAINPYVVFADFAINLMLVIIVYFIVTARISDVVYSSYKKAFVQAAANQPNFYGPCVGITRNGSNVYFKYANKSLFSGSKGLTESGRNAMVELAKVLTDAKCSKYCTEVMLTVSFPAEWKMQTGQKFADQLTQTLFKNGVTKPFTTSTRSQLNPDIHDKSSISRTVIAVLLPKFKL